MRTMRTLHRIEGHAIVCAGDRIADAAGAYPPELYNAADWARFQALLDQSDLVALGRLGHERHPNPGRQRLVATARVADLAADPADPRATLWNPARVPVADVLARLLPEGGSVAVTGGTDVFELFRGHGYDAFDLARQTRVTLPDGRPLFPGVLRGVSAAALLAAGGLVAGATEMLDAAAGVTLTRWLRPGEGGRSSAAGGA
jgi:hypothetical protein